MRHDSDRLEPVGTELTDDERAAAAVSRGGDIERGEATSDEPDGVELKKEIVSDVGKEMAGKCRSK